MAEYSRLHEEAGLMIPKPPSLAGRAKSWQSRSLGEGMPVMAGISWDLIVFQLLKVG